MGRGWKSGAHCFASRCSHSLTAALVVGFFSELAVELSVLHFTAALVDRFAGDFASHLLLLFRAKRSGCDQSKNKAQYRNFHFITSAQR